MTVPCVALKLQRKQSALMGSRFDSHGSGERKNEVVSNVKAMKGGSCKKHSQKVVLRLSPLLRTVRS